MMNKHKEKGLRGLLMTLTICVMSLFSVTAMAAPVSITGKVLDANGEPLIGASVVESGTSNGTVTDFDGMFTLVVEKDVCMIPSQNMDITQIRPQSYCFFFDTCNFFLHYFYNYAVKHLLITYL